MEDYDAIVAVGGPGSPLDVSGNAKVHKLIVDAWTQGKLIGALCYAVGALVWARNPETGKSIIWGKTIVAHPRPWDFTGDLPYPLYNEMPDNEGTDLVTPGFLFPLYVIVEDAVGPDGKVLSNPTATHEKPAGPLRLAVRDGAVGRVVEGVRRQARRGPRRTGRGGRGMKNVPDSPLGRMYRAHIQFILDKDIDGLLDQYTDDCLLVSSFTKKPLYYRGKDGIARAHAGYPRHRRPRHGDRVLGRDDGSATLMMTEQIVMTTADGDGEHAVRRQLGPSRRQDRDPFRRHGPAPGRDAGVTTAGDHSTARSLEGASHGPGQSKRNCKRLHRRVLQAG